MPIRTRPLILLVLVLLAGVAAGGLCAAYAQGQTVPSKGRGGLGPGLFRNLRDRLLGRSGPDALREATLLSDGSAARDVMEGLAGRGGDEITAGRAALWMGHYHYGAGDTEAALAWFEKARQAGDGPTERSESGFWVAQCRNILGRAQESASGSQGEGVAAVLGQVARLDGELRVGRVESALRGYLGLEADARRAGCLGPLLYRFGLAGASGAGGTDLGWSTVRAWEPACAISPEYALVQAMQPPAAVSAASGGEASATPFVEVPGGAAAERDSGGGTTGGASGAADRIPQGEGGPPPRAGVAGDAATPRSGADGGYAVQLGSFRDADRAVREAQRLEGLGLAVRVEAEQVDGVVWHRIRLGLYGSREEAEESALARCTGLEWRIVRVGP
jgi:hypothetical protein